MTIPKMILFDYGGTLLYKPDFDPRRGNEVLFRLIKDNPNNITLDEYTDKHHNELHKDRPEIRDRIFHGKSVQDLRRHHLWFGV